MNEYDKNKMTIASFNTFKLNRIEFYFGRHKLDMRYGGFFNQLILGLKVTLWVIITNYLFCS